MRDMLYRQIGTTDWHRTPYAPHMAALFERSGFEWKMA